MGAHETRTFKSGNSEAVRLPRDLGFGPGTPVTIEQSGGTLTIRRSEHAEARAAAWREENREAIEGWNRFVETNGLPLEALRLF